MVQPKKVAIIGKLYALPPNLKPSTNIPLQAPAPRD